MDHQELQETTENIRSLIKANRIIAEKIFQSYSIEQQLEILDALPKEIARNAIFLSKDAKVILEKTSNNRFAELALQEYMEDSLQLIACATPQQFSYALNLDIWNKDKIDDKKFREWVEIIKELPGNQFRLISKKLDINLLSTALKEYVTIFFDSDSLILMESLNQDYHFGMHDIEVNQAEVEALMHYIHIAAPNYFNRLIKNLLLGDEEEIYNEAKGFKDDNLSKEKLPSYEEAQNLFTHLDDLDYSYLQRLCKETKSNKLEVSYQEQTPFIAELKKLIIQQEGDQSKFNNKLNKSIYRLLNFILVAYGISPSDELKYKNAIKQAHDFFHIGLEYISEGSPQSALQLLDEKTAIEIYHVTYTLCEEIREKAKILLQDDDEIITRYSKEVSLKLRHMTQDPPLIYLKGQKSIKIQTIKDIILLNQELIMIENLRKSNI